MDHLSQSEKKQPSRETAPADKATAAPNSAPASVPPPPFALNASNPNDNNPNQKDQKQDKDSGEEGEDIGGGLGRVRKKMESAFNSDFSNVNIHKNSQSATEMGALAYTQGNNIHFAPGQFNPDSQKGQELIGHELTHVVQQRNNKVAPTTQTKSGKAANDDKGLESEADQMGAKAARGENTGMNGGLIQALQGSAQMKTAENPAINPAGIIQRQSLPSASPAPLTRQAPTTSDAPQTEEPASAGIIPPLILAGIQLAIDLSGVEESTSIDLNKSILPEIVAKSIEVEIEEGVFVSGTLIVESTWLSGIDLQLIVNADGTVEADIHLEHEFLGFPTVADAQVTQEGIAGTINVEIPADHILVPGLKTTGGYIHYNFGEESLLRGNLEVATEDGFATGSAMVEVDFQTGDWSGTVQMQGNQNTINVASGVDILLPEGFDFVATFGSEEGLTMEGSATVIPQVTLQSDEGIEAGGTAELDIQLSTEGLNFVLKKVRLAVTGGLNAPEMSEVLEGQNLSSEVDAGGMLTLWFENNSLNKMELEVTGGINSSSRRIGRLSFAGNANFSPFRFIGMLHGVTTASFNLAEGDRYTTSVMPGSQLFVSLDDAGISNVDASLGVEVTDQGEALAQLTVATSIPRGQEMSLSARLELLKRLSLTTVEDNGYGVSILPTANLLAKLEEGRLTEMEGSIAMEVADQEGDLLGGALEGKVVVPESGEGPTLENGLASASLLRDLSMDVGAGEVRVLEGTQLQVTFENGQLVGLSGTVAAVYDNGTREIEIAATVDYDPGEKILRSLDASMSTDETYSLFNDKLEISEIEGGISIRNNEVVALGGHARLDAYVGDFTASGEGDVTWTNEGGETAFVGSGWLEFSWYEDEEADRFLNGRIDATIDGENFSLLGSVEMGLMPGLTGTASLQMDQEMDPVISASLTYSTVLMEASELWAMEFGMGIQIPIVPVLVNLEAGILFGMSINTRPLMVFGTVGVENWRPKSSEFPDFFAELRASWGLDIEAKAMAYLELILGIDSVLHLTGGVRAGVGLNLPIELNPHIAVRGGEDGIGGEMGLDLSITPVLKMLIDAYLEWGVLGIWDGEKVWNLMDQELAELGDINWSGSFAFGDQEEPSGDAPTAQPQNIAPVGAPVTPPEGLNADSSLGFGNQEQEPESPAGLAGLTEGLEGPSAEDSESEVDQEGLGGEFQKIGQYADGIAAVGDLISVISDGFKWLMKGGPVGLILWMIFEKPSKEEMLEKKARVEEFRQALTGEALIEEGSTIDIMLGILSGEYSFWIIFDKSKPYRDMVDDKLHEEAILEDRAKILDGLIEGWTTEGDESRIITILKYTLSNEGGAGVRELTEYVGGPGRVRDQFEWLDFNDRDDLDHIFGVAYGNNENSVEGKPTYTAKEGATVKRMGRSWEDLALEAYGHESYSVYIENFPYNQSQISQIEAWQEWVNNQNSGGGMGDGHPNPHFEEPEPGGNGGNNSNPAPPSPQYQAYIPTMAEAVNLHASHVWQQRFQVPGTLEHAHWFENFEMIAQFAYEDANYKDALKAANPNISEIEEGSRVILPSKSELGNPWIEVEPVAIGSTGKQVWVAPDSNKNPEMWMSGPDRLVTDFAQEAMQSEVSQSAGEQLLAAATFTNETNQQDAENAVDIAKGLIDFILVSSNGASGGDGNEIAFSEAQPGDTIKITPDRMAQAAEIIYGHPERAAWIIQFNKTLGGSSTVSKSGSKSGGVAAHQQVSLTTGSSSTGMMKLPTWSEMNSLDPLPAAARGVAPKATIEVEDGDTWAKLAQKAYGDWSRATALADFEANQGITLDAGNIVTLPAISELTQISYEAIEQEVARIETEGGEGGNTSSPIATTAATHASSSDGDAFSTTPRQFVIGSNLTVVAGDTWSSIAIEAYDDFALFTRLANHPANVPFKTLPEGAEIYLPTLQELEDVPEFGLGLSPTGKPLMTEMVRIPTEEDLHHVWVENQAAEGAEEEGVWMMASTPFKLRPEAEKIMVETQNHPDIHEAAVSLHGMTQGAQTTEAIREKRQIIERLVNENFLASKFDDPTSISASVGRGGRNKIPDVKVVQRLLKNANYDPTWIDGIVGDKTITAIEDFQQKVLGQRTGIVELNSETWHKLKSYIPIDGDRYRGEPIDEMGKMGSPTNQYATVSSTGANVRETPSGTIKAGKIKYNENIRVLCLEAGQNPTWAYVISESGVEGWVNKDWVAYPLPEPNATLIQVRNGWTDVFDHYKNDYTPETGFDDRHMLVALAMANNNRQGVSVNQAALNQHLEDNFLYSWFSNQAQNNAIYNSIQIQSGSNIWLYSWNHIQNLRNSGVIATRPELTNDLIDFANDFVEYDQIMEFFGNSQVIMSSLKNDPAQFMENAISAVQSGFNLYSENVGQHLMGGVTNWLLDDPHIQFPSSLTDLPGYANLALDVLDIDFEDKLREAVGNDQLFDAAKDSFGLLTDLKEQGPKAVWANIGDQVSGVTEEIKVSLIAELKTYARNKIIKEVGKRIAAMFVPGAGILVALQSIWKLIKSLYQQAEEIVSMLNVIGSAMADIANGNVTNAATLVKDGLVDLTNVLVGALFDFLNLGGVRTKIRGFIEKTRNKVNSIIDKVIEFVKDKFDLHVQNQNLGINSGGGNAGGTRPVHRLNTKTRKAGSDKVEAHRLTENGLTTGNSTSSFSDLEGWNHARQCNDTFDEWVRAHKISHRIGGPGTGLTSRENLYISTKKANSDFKTKAEEPAEKQLRELVNLTPASFKYESLKDKIMFYEVDYDMHTANPHEAGFVKRADFRWGYKQVDENDNVGNQQTEVRTATVRSEAPPENPATVVYDINGTGWETLWSVTKVEGHRMKSNFWQNVTLCRNQKNHTFQNIDDLEDKLADWPGLTISESVLAEQCEILEYYIDENILRF